MKEALKAELAPLLIGLRNELKELKGVMHLINQKEAPELQKTTESNPIKEVAITNFPKPQDMNFLDIGLRKTRDSIKESAKSQESGILKLGKSFTEGFRAIKGNIFKVNVENQITMPKVIDVKVLNQIKQLEQIFIKNSSPSEAIPVKLTSSDGKRFYDAFVASFSASGGAAKILGNITVNTQDIEDLLDTLIICCNASLDKLTLLEAKDFATETTLSLLEGKDFATETTLDLVRACCDASKLVLDAIKAELVTLNAKDFATETTLALLEGKDFATQTTLAALLACCNLIEGNTDQLEAKLDSIISLLGGATGGTFQEFGEISLGTDATTFVVSFTVPSGKVGCLTNVTISGEGVASFKLLLDSTDKWSGRIEQHSPSFHASMSLEGTAGKIFKIEVTPDSSGASGRMFNATISGTVI